MDKEKVAQFIYKIFDLSTNAFLHADDVEAITVALMAAYKVTFFELEDLRQLIRDSFDYPVTHSSELIDELIAEENEEFQRLSLSATCAEAFFEQTNSRLYLTYEPYEKACVRHMNFSTFQPNALDG